MGVIQPDWALDVEPIEDSINEADLRIEYPHEDRRCGDYRNDGWQVENGAEDRHSLDVDIEKEGEQDARNQDERHRNDCVSECDREGLPEDRILEEHHLVVSEANEFWRQNDVVSGEAEIERAAERVERENEESQQPRGYEQVANQVFAKFVLHCPLNANITPADLTVGWTFP